MTVQVVTVDAAAALRAHVNSLTGSLVGEGHPLERGAWLGEGPRAPSRPRSPYRGAYAILSQVGGTLQISSDAPYQLPRVSASIYGVTALQAALAARAYTDALFALSTGPVTVTWTAADQTAQTAVIRSVDSITGPLQVADSGPEARYLVDAVLVCTAA